MLRTLFTPERVRFIRFCVVGLSGVAVNLGVFSLFDRAEVPFLLSNVAGFLVSVLTNFLLNDFWTWGDRQKHGHAHFFQRLAKFYLVASVGGAVQLGVAYGVRAALQLHKPLAVLCGIAVATVINYAANHYWTFRERDPKHLTS